jgi:hypothetical protein
MKLTCDLCGSDLQMNPGGQSATCVNCGLEYPKERLLEKLSAASAGSHSQKPAEPKPAPVNNPAVTPMSEPVVKPAVTPKAEPVAKPAVTPKAEPVVKPTTHSTKPVSPPPPPPMRKLFLKRKFSINALAAQVAIFVDGKQVALLNVGVTACVPISQARHVVQARIVGLIKSELNPVYIDANDRDYCGEFFVRSHAFSAEFVFEVKPKV